LDATVEEIRRHIREVPDFPQRGISFKDITHLIEDGPGFHAAVDGMAWAAEGVDYCRVLSAEARGFVFGAALAYPAWKGLILARRPDKLPERPSPLLTSSSTARTLWRSAPTPYRKAPARSSSTTSSPPVAPPAPCANSSRTPADDG